MGTLRAELVAPDDLVPSLLHAGLQKVTRLTVENQGRRPADLAEVWLSIPGVSRDEEPLRVKRDVRQLPAGESDTIEGLSFPIEQLDRRRLEDLLARGEGITSELIAASDPELGTMLGSRPVRFHAPSVWAWKHHPEALAAFVQRESRSVTKVIEEAGPFLRQFFTVTSFAEALALDEPDVVPRAVSALYMTLAQSFHIRYEWEPRNYEIPFQNVRLHGRVLDELRGTCIDLALLLAGCLERVFLDPLIVSVKVAPTIHHALVGCWAGENLSTSAVIRRPNPPLAAHIASGDLILLDPTGFTADRGWPESRAADEARGHVTTKPPVWALDVARARVPAGRRKAITPLPLGDGPRYDGHAWSVLRHAEAVAREQGYDQVERGHLLLAAWAVQPQLLQALFDAAAGTVERLRLGMLRKSPQLAPPRLLRETENVQAVLEGAEAYAGRQGIIGPVELMHSLVDHSGGPMHPNAQGGRPSLLQSILAPDRSAQQLLHDKLAHFVRSGGTRSYPDATTSWSSEKCRDNW